MKASPKISGLNAIGLVIVSLFFDILSFVPLLNIITGLIGWFIFSLWFFLLGFGLLEGRRLVTMMSSMIIEVVPFLSWLPTMTIGVIALILMVNLKRVLPLPKVDSR